MNIEEQLTNLKNEYQSTKAPSYLIYDGWPTLKLQLAGRKAGFFSAYFKRAIIFAALLLMVLVTTAKVSQAAKPGDKLYPIKLATENIASFVTGDQTSKIENRAQEIINLSKNNNNIDTAVKRYEDTIDSSANSSSDKNKQELKNTLQNQEEKFRGTESTNQHNQQLLEKAAEKTHEVQGEIKGVRDNNPSQEDQRNQNSSDHQNNNESQNSNHSQEK